MFNPHVQYPDESTPRVLCGRLESPSHGEPLVGGGTYYDTRTKTIEKDFGYTCFVPLTDPMDQVWPLRLSEEDAEMLKACFHDAIEDLGGVMTIVEALEERP